MGKRARCVQFWYDLWIKSISGVVEPKSESVVRENILEGLMQGDSNTVFGNSVQSNCLPDPLDPDVVELRVRGAGAAQSVLHSQNNKFMA